MSDSTTPAATPGRRRRRADAQRNRERLLAEAHEVFQQDGTEASLEKIARHAGVAIGTLYAHFPHRRALLGELLREQLKEIFDRGDELLAAGSSVSPGEALTRWMRGVAEHGAVYQGLAGELLGSLDDKDSELAMACHRMSAAGVELADRARTAGAIRADLSGDDIFALVSAATWLRTQVTDEPQFERLLAVLFAGMRPPEELGDALVEGPGGASGRLST